MTLTTSGKTTSQEIEKKKSTVKKKTLTPVWREVFALGAPQLQPSEGQGQPSSSSNGTILTLTVDDYDLLGKNDHMAELTVDLATVAKAASEGGDGASDSAGARAGAGAGGLADGAALRRWFPLTHKDEAGNADAVGEAGEVELVMRWRFNPDRVVKDTFVELTDEEGLVPTADEEAAHGAGHVKNEIMVCLVQARGLAVMDKAKLFGKGNDDELTAPSHHPNNQRLSHHPTVISPFHYPTMPLLVAHHPSGSSDPIVTLAVVGSDAKPVKSKAKKKTLTPVWKQQFALSTILNGNGEGEGEAKAKPKGESKGEGKGEGEEQPVTLSVTVDDWDLIGSNDHMGEVMIDLRGELGPDGARLRDGKPIRAWYKLVHQDSREPTSTEPSDVANKNGGAARKDGGGSSDGEVELVLRWRYNPVLDPKPKSNKATGGSVRWGRDIDGKMSPRDSAGGGGGRSVASSNTIASGGSATLGESGEWRQERCAVLLPPVNSSPTQEPLLLLSHHPPPTTHHLTSTTQLATNFPVRFSSPERSRRGRSRSPSKSPMKSPSHGAGGPQSPLIDFNMAVISTGK